MTKFSGTNPQKKVLKIMNRTDITDKWVLLWDVDCVTIAERTITKKGINSGQEVLLRRWHFNNFTRAYEYLITLELQSSSLVDLKELVESIDSFTKLVKKSIEHIDKSFFNTKYTKSKRQEDIDMIVSEALSTVTPSEEVKPPKKERKPRTVKRKLKKK